MNPCTHRRPPNPCPSSSSSFRPQIQPNTYKFASPFQFPPISPNPNRHMSISLLSPPALQPLLRSHSARRLLLPRPSPAMATCIHRQPRPQIDPSSLYNLVVFPELVDLPTPAGDSDEDVDEIWSAVRSESISHAESEPLLRNLYCHLVLSHPSLESALATHLATKLSLPDLLPAAGLRQLLLDAMLSDPAIGAAARADLRAARDRDPACSQLVHCFLYYKGFLALQAHRVAHRLWLDRRPAAALLIQSRVAEVFAVDIHPGARIGSGVLLDHATGVVIGETAVVGDDVSILHNVTLGGTGKEAGDRHPKIGKGVLVGAGTQILGSVRVGEGAKVGAGSVVLKEVPARTTAVGNPARLIGGKENPVRLERMAGLTMDHTSWSDYVI